MKDENFLRKLVAAEYAEHIVNECKLKGGDLSLLSDQIAALIGILECAVRDARKVANGHIVSLAADGSALLREAAVHLPVRSPFLLRVLAGEPSTPLELERLQELFVPA